MVLYHSWTIVITASRLQILMFSLYVTEDIEESKYMGNIIRIFLRTIK